MTKDTQMTSCEAEIKAVAKAVTSSLKRDGHNVPHSSVLSALAAALNKRDWQTLKTGLQASARKPLKTPVPVSTPAPAALPASYDDKTTFFLRLAWALGRPVVTLPDDAAQAKAAALAQCGEMLNGVLKWSGWTVPAGLIFATSRLDAGDFVPEKLSTAAAFVVRLPRSGEVSIEVGFREGAGWFLTRTGASDFFAALEHRVSIEQILEATTPPAEPRPMPAADPLEGPSFLTKPACGPVSDPVGDPVAAKFRTDDGVFEVAFDARAYLAQASEATLGVLVSESFRGCEASDEVGLFAAEQPGGEAVKEACDYLSAIQRSPMKDPPGFEVSLDAEQALRWLHAHRPLELARILCEREGVMVTQISEGPTQGLWDWHDGVDGCEVSLDTRDEAYLDACEALGLLALAIAEMS